MAGDAVPPVDRIREALDFQMAQLRQAYAHLVNGTVGNHKSFADGLIAPCIRRYEELIAELESGEARPEVPPEAEATALFRALFKKAGQS